MNNKVEVGNSQSETLYVNVLVNNDRLKTYNKNSKPPFPHYYLKDGEEFSLEFISAFSSIVGIEIKINGTKISDNYLIIEPGQRVVLDRYLDDNKRFKFAEYSLGNIDDEFTEVRNEAYLKSEIGVIEVKVYKQIEQINSNIYINYNQTISTNTLKPNDYFYDYWINPKVYYGNENKINFTSPLNNLSFTSSTNIKSLNIDNDTRDEEEKKAGKITEGSKSDQKLDIVQMTFSDYCSVNVKLRLMPLSSKPIEKSDLVNYCSECGKKQKKTNRFCPNCGNKL